MACVDELALEANELVGEMDLIRTVILMRQLGIVRYKSEDRGLEIELGPEPKRIIDDDGPSETEVRRDTKMFRHVLRRSEK
jgi:hypothetical protein